MPADVPLAAPLGAAAAEPYGDNVIPFLLATENL